MKKIMTLAFAAMFAASAFAGDSDALKAILKAKTYAEAKQLLDSSLASLPTPQEKAKAYNKLMELALVKVSKEQAIITGNQMAEQFKQGKVEAYDTLGFYDAVHDALKAAVECYKYDQMPDEKGKVKPKFESNAGKIWQARVHLVNGGQWAAQKGNNEGVLKYWGTFLDTDDAPIFASQDKTSEKDYIGQVAMFSARYAYQAKDMERANRYCDIAMKDAEQSKDALNLKLYVMKDGLKTKNDSIAYIGRLKELYAQDKNNEVVLDNLNTMYSNLNMKDEQKKLLEEAVAANPKNFVALADLGMFYINENDADNAVKYLREALAVKPENPLVMTYLGACLNVQGANEQVPAKRKAFYEEAVKLFDKVKELDPDKQQANWGYNRYQAYYGLYGANDARTKAAEAESK